MSEPAPARPGLRERKKAQTRAAIQRQALRLFGEQGYDATTMDQVAAAADVSPSTVFRYFATKAELVRFNAFDVPIAVAYRDQPSELGPIPALRSALHATLGDLGDAELSLHRRRQQLILAVPALWESNVGTLASALALFTELFADRTGLRADDPAIRAPAGAALGVILAVWLDWAEHPEWDVRVMLDDALAQLESGFGA